jgi:hypothetical protein
LMVLTVSLNSSQQLKRNSEATNTALYAYCITYQRAITVFNGLIITRQAYAYLLLVLMVPTKFHWNPTSSCREIAQKQILLYMHSA